MGRPQKRRPARGLAARRGFPSPRPQSREATRCCGEEGAASPAHGRPQCGRSHAQTGRAGRAGAGATAGGASPPPEGGRSRAQGPPNGPAAASARSRWPSATIAGSMASCPAAAASKLWMAASNVSLRTPACRRTSAAASGAAPTAAAASILLALRGEWAEALRPASTPLHSGLWPLLDDHVSPERCWPAAAPSAPPRATSRS